MTRILRSLTLVLLLTGLGTAPVWAEGTQFPVKADGTPPCNISWFEGRTYNAYLSTQKGVQGTLLTSAPNPYASTPLKGWNVPCPTTPGQYYSQQSWTNDQGEGIRGFELAFMVINPALPLTIQSIDPFAGKQGTAVPVTIVGTGLLFTGVPSTLGIPSSGIVISNLVVTDTKVTALLTIPQGEPVGTKDVILGGPAPKLVTNVPGGFAVLANVVPVFAVGTRVKTALLLNVRTAAGLTTPLAGPPQPKGAEGTIIEGPVVIGGVNWWKVDYMTGTDGWSAEKTGTTPYLIIVQQ